MDDEIIDPQEEYASLVRGLERADPNFCLHFVQCPRAKQDKLIKALQASIPEKTFGQITLTEAVRTLQDQIKAITLESNPDFVCIQGLEHSIAAYEQEGKALGWSESEFFRRGVPPILSYLNMQRENFRDNTKQGLIFLISDPKLLTYFIRRCPDFFDWRSGNHCLEDWNSPP